jgi:chromosome segregation ATPase
MSLPVAVLQQMRDNAVTLIEQLESQRWNLLDPINQLRSQQLAVIATVQQANSAYDQANGTLRDLRKRLVKQRVRAAVAQGTAQEANEDAALQALQDARDAAQTDLDTASQQKQDAQALLSNLTDLQAQEVSIKEQISELAAERAEAIAVRDDLDQKIQARNRQQ